jgi:hydroxymethylglutaryl-CoA reductase
MRAAVPTRPASGRAPGKVILLGEHAVVYGRTAIAGSIDRQVVVRVRPGAASSVGRDARTAAVVRRAGALLDLDTAALDVAIASDLPIAVGLGSSAALSVALVRALARHAGRALDAAAVCAAALELEKLFHGFPSGVDNTAATYGGLITFRCGGIPSRLVPPAPLRLVIALGRAPRRTYATVTALRERQQSDAQRHDALFDAIDALARQAEVAIAAGQLALLGQLMCCNHELLRELGVSTDELDAMVDLAGTAGALGAKLTGGGGGGAVACLPEDDGRRLVAGFARAGWDAFTTDIGTARRDPHATDDRHTLRDSSAPG